MNQAAIETAITPSGIPTPAPTATPMFVSPLELAKLDVGDAVGPGVIVAVDEDEDDVLSGLDVGVASDKPVVFAVLVVTPMMVTVVGMPLNTRTGPCVFTQSTAVWALS